MLWQRWVGGQGPGGLDILVVRGWVGWRMSGRHGVVLRWDVKHVEWVWWDLVQAIHVAHAWWGCCAAQTKLGSGSIDPHGELL